MAYAPLPPVGVEFNEIAPPVHSGFGVTVAVIAGLGAILTTVVALPVNPFPSTTVTVYVVATVGDAMTLVPVVAESPLAGAHV